MIHVVHGPYEHVGAYANLAESERFDTSGTSKSFCPFCEHAPCIAGFPCRCRQRPRYIVANRMSDEISDVDLPWSHWFLPMLMAVGGLASIAAEQSAAGDAAMKWLGWTRESVLKTVAAHEEVRSDDDHS